jgi:hypothetical protein
MAFCPKWNAVLVQFLHDCKACAPPFSDRSQHRSQLVACTSKPGRNWFNTFPAKASWKQQKYLKFVVLFYPVLVVFIGRFHRVFFIRWNCHPTMLAWSLKTWCGDSSPQVSLPMNEVGLFWSLQLNGILWALKWCKDCSSVAIPFRRYCHLTLCVYLLHSYCRYFYQLQWKNAV